MTCRPLRALVRAPVFTAVVVVTLALGLGATAAIFSMVDAVLLAPLPYPDSGRLVRLFSVHPEEGVERAGASSGDIVEWRRRSSQFEGVAGWYVMGRTLADGPAAEIVNVGQVSEDFFGVLGLEALLGRTFTAEETARSTFNSAAAPTGADPVVVLSHRAWQQRFGGDPSVVGRVLTLDRRRWRVLGVMPAGFDYPDPTVELWIPWSFEGDRAHDQRYLGAVGRLEPGVTLEQARAGLDAVAAALGEEHPESNRGWRVALTPLREELVGGARPLLLVLLGAVVVVLLVICLNVSSLQLVRLSERRREVAVRFALGASVSRVARQLLLENLLLAACGGVAALAVAFVVLGATDLLVPGGMPRWEGVRLGPRGLGVVAALTVGAGLLFGGAPLAAVLERGTAGLAGAGPRALTLSRRGEGWRRRLVIGELAMAVALLVAAGLFVRTLVELRATDVGFQPEGVAVLPVTLDNLEYDSGAKSRAYYQELLTRLQSVSGVVSVGAATALPMSPIGPDFDRPVWAEGEAPPPGGARRADVRMATPGYFETLGIRLLRGRTFDQSDTPESRPVVVVSETLARQTWPGEEAVGKRLVIDYASSGTYPYEVVGLVGDVRFRGIRSAPRPEVYLPHAQRSYLIMNVAVRTAVPAEALVPALRQAVLEVDPLQPAYRVQPLEQLVAASIARDRLGVVLIGCFGGLALVLALTGIFGVLSQHVGSRGHEVGVRTALGASRREILALVLGSGLRLTGAGIALGVLVAVATSRLLAGSLFGVSPLDPGTYALVAILVATGATVACYLPARRASRLDPVVALRQDHG
ncbi:MAG TPA: ABC transporter permease [Thermoanaerobaculia bacterium]|nr:ABC transporter permease [Thermoanaerobaculia bacterium]